MKIIISLCVTMAVAMAGEAGRATFAGRVLDPSNAAVPRAKVVVTNEATGDRIEAASGRDGRYAVSDLPPGTYAISIEAEGFEKFLRQGVAVRAGETAWIDVPLKLGAMVVELTVRAKAPPAEAVPEAATKPFEQLLEIREVRESSAKDVGEALARIDGLWKIRKGGIANDVVLRGFQQDNLNVLVDGVRIHGACPNNMDPPAFHVDFAEIRQAEIAKGPFDMRNQGGLGGVVSLVSKNPEPGLRITPNLSAGSFGYFNPSVTGSYSAGKLHGLAGYSYRRSEPYRDGAGKRFTQYANYKDPSLEADAFDIGTAWFKFGTALSETQRLDVSHTHQGAGLVLYPYLLMDALYDNADRATASYNAGRFSGALKQVNVRSYFTQVKHWMTDEYRVSSAGAPRPFGMATFAQTRTFGAQAEAEFSGFIAGLEAFRRNWSAVNTMRHMSHYMDQPSIPGVDLTVAGIYGQYQRTLAGRLQLTAGARLDNANSRARSRSLNPDLYWAYKGTRSLSQTDTMPSASLWLGYSLRPGLELFAGAGHTARPPDPQERYFALSRMGTDWVGNPNLRPPQNTEIDVGVGYRAGRLSLRPTAFYSWLRDFVVIHRQVKVNLAPAVANSMARSYENVPARMYGGELSYSLVVAKPLLLLGGLSLARGVKEPLPAFRIADRDLAELPPLRSRAALRYGTRLFFVELEGIAVKSQARVDSDLGESATPGYAVLNMKAGIHAPRLNLAAGIDNALNRLYYEHYSFQRDPFRSGVRVPEPGRSVYLTLAYDFGK